MSQSKTWLVLLFVCLLVAIRPVSVVYAAENSVYDSFQNKSDQQKKSDTTSPISKPPKASMGLYLLQFFGSFIIIIGLLYVVLRFVSRKSKLLNSGGIYHALGGHSFGNNRSLQMVMVGDTLYLLGVGDSITLIRTIPPGEEQTKLLESVAVQPQDMTGKRNWTWDFLKGKTAKEKWDDLFMKKLKELQSSQSDNKE